MCDPPDGGLLPSEVQGAVATIYLRFRYESAEIVISGKADDERDIGALIIEGAGVLQRAMNGGTPIYGGGP